MEKLPYVCARWVTAVNGADKFDADAFERREGNKALEDRDGHLVVLFRNEWAVRYAEDNHKAFRFNATAQLKRGE